MITGRESSIYGLPVYRLDTRKTLAWLLNPTFRERFAKNLSQIFKRGVIVARDTMMVIAFVSPAGNVSAAKPPLRRLPIDLIANAPEPEECGCQAWIHPDSGIWAKNQCSKDEHHPWCQFHRRAVPNWLKDNGAYEGAREQLVLDGRKD